jgi:hypothetical protein
MKLTRREFLHSALGSTVAISALGSCADKGEARGQTAGTDLPFEEAEQIAAEVYIYGYALIATDVIRIQMTNVESPGAFRAPMGQFFHQKTFELAISESVSLPNTDTLDSVAWVDLGAEPWVVSWPDMHARYCQFPVYDLWMSVIDSPGTRTTGDSAQTYALTGPDWTGELPAGIRRIKSPTRYALILGRISCTGTPQDYAAVDASQAQFKLYPLGDYGKPYTPPLGKIDPNPLYSVVAPVRQVVNDMDVPTYFGTMAKLMKDNPPPSEDAPIVAKMAKIGLVPGQEFDMVSLAPRMRLALRRGSEVGFSRIKGDWRAAGTVQNHWVIPAAAGKYGTDYLTRAFIAAYGWPAGLPEDAVHPFTRLDASGKQLLGANKYVLHFDKGTPPVDGFWSITVYDPQYRFVPNPLNKFAVSSRDELTYNADGSLDLHFQQQAPGQNKEVNWVPTPAGNFTLMLRMYWPQQPPPSILPPGRGTWKIPAVERAG